MEQITSSRSFAGIFPPALRSLWSPITPSSQAKSARRLTALTVTFIIKQALSHAHTDNRAWYLWLESGR